ncbi:MAG: protein kinase [candidate division Zixibacteria bacterium]|nr:protein kinase [candidate division Zixibacteria bacterium]MDD5425323.1 protein kinase [candidate division Zixibacteria bacterium]
MDEQYIGNYKILKKIGAGGMAKVYLAVHKDVPNLRVVLKVLSDSRLADRFKQEADKLALLDGNPHICQIKHFFNHGDDFVIAMEYIEGATLDDIIKSKSRLPVDESVKIVCDILNILGFAHQKGIYHRDIKPGNIMIDRNSHVKVIDFGIAKAESDPNLTLAGTACGTPAYMAPEQFTPSEKVDYSLVDIYAVGTTLYYMLTGELPFKGDNEFALRDAKLFNQPEKPSKFNRDIPRTLDEIILKALEKNAGDRYSSCQEMQRALKPFQKDIGKLSVTSEVVAKDTRPISTPSRKRGLPLSIAGVVAVIIIGAIAYKIFFTKKTESKIPVIPVPAELTPPELLSPADNSIIDNPLPIFTWKPPDTTGFVYNLEYAQDSLFGNPRVATYLTSPEYTPLEPLAPGRYFWHVQSEDEKGNQSKFSSYRTFTIETAGVAIPEGYLEITIQPAGDIYVDNQLRGKNKTRLELALETGRHKIRVVNGNSVEKSFEREVVIAENTRRTESFKFSSIRPEPEPIVVRVRIGSRPLNGATVYIDGERQALKTPNTYELTPGKHIIRGVLTTEDGRTLDKTDTLVVIENQTDKHFIEFTN